MGTRARTGLGLALLAFVAYVSLGLPDGLLGVAWPSIRGNFGLAQGSLGTLFITTTVGYLASSFFGGRLMACFRLGTILALSTFFAGAALVGYAVSPRWWTLVVLGVFAGLGGGGIDVALNIYVATHHGERMMQWLHASYGVGAMIGPVIMTLAIGSLGTWRWGYAIVGGLQLTLAATFVATASLWDSKTGPARGAEPGDGQPDAMGEPRYLNVPTLETLREGRVWLSMFLFFLYMGIEVSLGTWAYTLLTEARGVAPRFAGFFMASYWGIFTVGRILAGLAARRVGHRALVLGSVMAALLGFVLLTLDVAGSLDLFACAFVGVALAPILAALLSGTVGRVGPRHVSNTIGMQMAASGLGTAAIPAFTGIVAEHLSLDAIPPFLIVLAAIFLALYLFSLRWGRAVAAES